MSITLTCPECTRILTETIEITQATPCTVCEGVYSEGGILDARPLSGEIADDSWAIEYYDRVADIYDAYLPLTFETFDCDENIERKKMYERLVEVKCESVLEVGCGTGRDSIGLIEALKNLKTFHYQDVSLPILKHAISKLNGKFPNIEQNFHCSNSHKLPYQDEQFDAVYHFGGLNTFDNRKLAIEEMHRVTKDGGVIVIGDESIPPWWRNTEFSKVLINSNPHYDFAVPLNDLPVAVSDVELKWIIGGVFYSVSFVKNKRAPHANFHLPIPGDRGGNHYKRYYGQLEGIAPELKDRLNDKALEQNRSRVELLESIVSNYLKSCN